MMNSISVTTFLPLAVMFLDHDPIRQNGGSHMKTRINRLIIFFFLIVIYITVCTGCGQVPSSAAQNQTSAQNVSQAPSSFLEQTTELSNGVCIAEVFSYTGPYVEDGSNDPCEGICAVRLYNPTSIHYQYLRFSVETSGGRQYLQQRRFFPALR